MGAPSVTVMLELRAASWCLVSGGPEQDPAPQRGRIASTRLLASLSCCSPVCDDGLRHVADLLGLLKLREIRSF